MKKILYHFSLTCILLLLVACDDIPEYKPITVTTYATKKDDIGIDYAKIKGNVKVTGKNTVVEYGFKYGKSPDLKYKLYNVSDISETSLTLTHTLDNLSSNTEYSFQTYAIDSKNNLYLGDVQSFKTREYPKIWINSIRMEKVGEDAYGIKTYHIVGSASLIDGGYKVTKSGFFFSPKESILGANIVNYPLANHHIECKVKNGQISFDIETDDNYNIYNNTSYFMAYMVLEDGEIYASKIVGATAD